MTTILTINSAAGSAGKSATAAALAAILGEQGQRVVVVDLDAQGTVTDWLGVDGTTATHTTGDVLLRRVSLNEALMDTQVPGVRLLPANRSVDESLVRLANETGGEQRLRLALAGIDADVVLIDTPGAIGLAAVTALVAATLVLTVTMPTLKEARGIDEIRSTAAAVAEAYNPGLAFVGIVPCAVPLGNSGGRLYADVMAGLADTYGPLLGPAVRRTTRVPESHAHGAPIVLHDPAGGASADYRAVVAWLQDAKVLPQAR